MSNVRASVAMSAVALGAEPKAKPLGGEVGSHLKVPSPDFLDLVRDALAAASAAAAMGMVAQVSIIMVPDTIESLN